MKLRAYESGDLDAMVALDDVCFDAAFRFSRAAMRRFAEAKKARVVIAESDIADDVGAIAGFCILHVECGSPKFGYIVTLDVAVAFRRCGLARQIMREIERLAREADCEFLGLHVWSENTIALRFYESVGFSFSHVASDFYGSGRDAWVMRREL